MISIFLGITDLAKIYRGFPDLFPLFRQPHESPSCPPRAPANASPLCSESPLEELEHLPRRIPILGLSRVDINILNPQIIHG
ncbi:MAG: hypothetical protein ACK53L_26145, partial [Pirellulaceae bacterium]